MTDSRRNIACLLVVIVLALYVKYPAKAEEYSPWQHRAQHEAEWRDHGWFLIPHEANYFFPITYNTSPHPTSTSNAQNKEAKFQLSFKILIAEHLLGPTSYLYFGYTQLSMWQAYDENRSAPFRDINHAPEAIMTFETARDLGYVTMRQIDVGLIHESNGASDPDSRSWNRIYGRFVFDRDKIYFAVRPWIRIPEPTGQDDNKDILDYMGYGDFTLSYFWSNHVLSFLLRNNLQVPENKGAIQIDYSFPLTHRLTGLIQYFNGYGESLVDYNQPNNRFSIGIALNEWQ